jgi:hypothetical protein
VIVITRLFARVVGLHCNGTLPRPLVKRAGCLRGPGVVRRSARYTIRWLKPRVLFSAADLVRPIGINSNASPDRLAQRSGPARRSRNPTLTSRKSARPDGALSPTVPGRPDTASHRPTRQSRPFLSGTVRNLKLTYRHTQKRWDSESFGAKTLESANLRVYSCSGNNLVTFSLLFRKKGLLHFEWVKNAWSRGAKPRGTRVWELC